MLFDSITTFFKWACFSIVVLLTAASLPAVAEKTLVLAGPPATVSWPLLHMIESHALADVADKVTFRLWRNPDQLRALTLDGSVDFTAMPSNVAANLYNRGVPLQLLDVSVWGILWIVSRDANAKTLADFKGKEIAVPFRADMPDVLLRFLIEQAGFDVRRDFKLRYSASPMDAMQLLIMRRVDHALLAEPAVSMALRKTHSFPLSLVAPELYRSVSLKEEWGRLLHKPARIPQAGMVVLGKSLHDKALIKTFEAAYHKAWQWCAEHREACAQEVAKHIDMLSVDAVADSIATMPNYYATAKEAQAELESFFSLLLKKEPASVGGKLPDAAFYGVMQ